MPPSEAEILAARLERIKVLLEEAERECAASADAHATFEKLNEEMAALRARLKTIAGP